MLREFYKLGMMHALQKHAVLGELLRTGPGVIAKSLARRKAIGEAKGEMRRTLGLEAPEWRRGGILELPSLAAVRTREAILNAMKSDPEELPPPVAKIESEPMKKEPEKPKTKEIKLKLPKPKIPKPKMK